MQYISYLMRILKIPAFSLTISEKQERPEGVDSGYRSLIYRFENGFRTGNDGFRVGTHDSRLGR